MAAFKSHWAAAQRGAQSDPGGSARGSVLDLLGPSTTADFRAEILAAAERLEPGGISRGLNRATATMGLADCIDDVLIPVLRQMDRWWAAGRCTRDQERMATEVARAWLDGRCGFAPPPRHPDAVVLACGPRDRHTVGVEALALLLRFQGVPCRMLGARSTVFDLSTAARATAAATVAVLSHRDSDRPYAISAINALHRQGYRVAYAGDAFAQRSTRELVAGDYLGARMRDACGWLCRTMAVSQDR